MLFRLARLLLLAPLTGVVLEAKDPRGELVASSSVAVKVEAGQRVTFVAGSVRLDTGVHGKLEVVVKVDKEALGHAYVNVEDEHADDDLVDDHEDDADVGPLAMRAGHYDIVFAIHDRPIAYWPMEATIRRDLAPGTEVERWIEEMRKKGIKKPEPPKAEPKPTKPEAPKDRAK